MIDLYTWFCPNGHKIHIVLEETGLPYQVKPVSIVAGEQFASSYRALNPDTIAAQVDSAVAYGLTAAWFGEIGIRDGAVAAGNFDTYRMLRLTGYGRSLSRTG
jgi:hypothetical protein